MATYTHFEAIPPNGSIISSQPDLWVATIGTAYTATSNSISIVNFDGTQTIAAGSFTVSANQVTGGTINSLERVSNDGSVLYESITGMSTDAVQFLAASHITKFELTFAGADYLNGYSGDDVLNGYGGGDHMAGGAGNDTYFVDSVFDIVTELPNAGTDSVVMSIDSYDLPANVENVLIEKGGAIVHGNSLDNTIGPGAASGITVYGLGGNDTLGCDGGTNVLDGGDGNDKIYASFGNNTLTGGNDDDTFTIGFGGNDVITDFAAGPGVHDRINLAGYEPNSPQLGQNVFRDLADVLAHSKQVGADTVVDLGAGTTLTLQNVQKGALAADDFFWKPTPMDFKGDTVSDILWHNDNGQVSIWENGSIANAHIIGQVVNPNWHIAGSGDFDGNGRQDVLWHNDDGTVSIWDNGNINKAHFVAGAGVVPNSWQIAKTGDFDGNGHSDILWRNDNGAVSIWDNGDINKAHIVSGAGVVPTNWHIADTGDFDGNGKDDILWRRDDGSVSIWDNGDINKAHIVAGAGVVPDNWHIAATGDFDGNGHSDILWHRDDGSVSIWDNGDINQAHIIAGAGVVPTSWHIVETGDYDGNRQSDVLWHNDNGSVSIWNNGDINKAHIISGAGVVPDAWHIV